MIDLEAITARKVALKASKAEANQKVKDTRQAAAKARGEANRAVGQKLPNAAEAQAQADVATQAHKQAEKEYKAYNDAYQAILKEESAAIKEKQQEDAINESMSGYDVVVEESDEYFGVFYDADARYVGFDIGIAGRAEASFNISDRSELEKVIAALTAMAEKM